MHWLSKVLLMIASFITFLLILFFGIFSWHKTVYFSDSQEISIKGKEFLTFEIRQSNEPPLLEITTNFLSIKVDDDINIYPVIKGNDTLQMSQPAYAGMFYFKIPPEIEFNDIDLTIKFKVRSGGTTSNRSIKFKGLKRQTRWRWRPALH